MEAGPINCTSERSIYCPATKILRRLKFFEPRRQPIKDSQVSRNLFKTLDNQKSCLLLFHRHRSWITMTSFMPSIGWVILVFRSTKFRFVLRSGSGLCSMNRMNFIFMRIALSYVVQFSYELFETFVEEDFWILIILHIFCVLCNSTSYHLNYHFTYFCHFEIPHKSP